MARPKKTVTETAENKAVEEIKTETAAAGKPEAKEEPKAPEKTYSEADVQEMVAKAVAEAMAGYNRQIVLSTPKSERVNLLWQAPVAEDNVQEFGPNGRYGRIIGPTGTFFVPKDEFSLIIDGLTRLFLERRWLIVVSGLTDEEREAFGVLYHEGEYLDRAAFARLAEQGDKLLDIYPDLCDGNRRIVANAIYTAWTERNPHVTRDLVEALDGLCKKIDPKETTFKTILKEMAAAAAE